MLKNVKTEFSQNLVGGHSAYGVLSTHGLVGTSIPSEEAQSARAGGQIVSDTHRSWTLLDATSRERRCIGNFRRELTSERPQLTVILEQVGGQVLVGGDGCRLVESKSRQAPHMSMIPSGMRAWQEIRDVSFIRDLTLAFDADRIGEEVDELLDLEKIFRRRIMFADFALMRIAELFAGECQSARTGDTLYGDSLGLALFIGLSRLDDYSSSSSSSKSSSGMLAPWQLHRAFDYLEGHLEGGACLKTLANLTRLSQSYLTRAFKASTGVTPNQWLRDARVKRAQQLLMDRSRNISQIAVETGFADQAHFTRSFRDSTGESPGLWRRTRLGPQA